MPEDFEDPEDEQEEVEILPAGQENWPGAWPKQAAFLTALVNTSGQWAKAARYAKIARSTPYRWLEADENFAALYKQALRQITQALEDEATRRSVEGVTKGVYFQGDRVATERVYSDGLMMFLLRGAAPEKYRERTEVSGQLNHNLKFAGTMEELLGLYKKLQETAG